MSEGEDVRSRHMPDALKRTRRPRRRTLVCVEGKSNKEVASALVVSVHTVEAALTSIYRKLDIRSRTELARRLVEESKQ